MKLVKGTYPPDVREHMRGGNGTVTLEHAIQEGINDLPEKLRVMALIRLPVGASIGFHVHEGEAEVYRFESGKGRVTDDDTVYGVAPGDVVVTPSGHGHAVENIGDEELTFTAVVVKN